MKNPNGLLYQLDGEDIVITSVMHLKRRPNYWRKRLIKKNKFSKRTTL
jgi:hypothetical protein